MFINNFDPVAFQILSFEIRWYSLAYIAGIIIGWLLLILATSLFCSKVFPNERELTRKIVHIGTGPIIPIACWLNVSKDFALLVACIITAALIINYRLRLIKSIENVDRKSFGTIAYGVSITSLIFLFWSNNPSAATAGVLVMAFGDGLAGLIGRNINSSQWIIFGQKKSLIGTLSMYLVTILVLSSISHVTGTNFEDVDILIISSLATILEQFSPLGIDNITVPIGVALSWQWLLLN